MRILIVGCGSIGKRHARNLRALGVQDLLLFDPNKDRAEAVAHEIAARSVPFVEQAYGESPNLALVCAPTSLHLPLAWEAFLRGCDIFIEKPFSDSMQGVADFVEAAESGQRLLVVGYNFRFDAVMNQVQRWICEGKVGHVTSARFHFGSYLPSRHPWEDYRCGYGARRELGGGVILDAVHELDMAIWLFGMPETIYCVGGKYSDLAIDVEDTAEIVMSYADKVVAVHLDYVQRPAERWCEIIGTAGRIQADVFAHTARYFDAESRTWRHAEGVETLEDSYKAEMKHLIDCVEGRAKPIVDGRAAAQSLLLADEARASMESGSPVAVRAVAEVCAG